MIHQKNFTPRTCIPIFPEIPIALDLIDLHYKSLKQLSRSFRDVFDQFCRFRLSQSIPGILKRMRFETAVPEHRNQRKGHKHRIERSEKKDAWAGFLKIDVFGPNVIVFNRKCDF